MNADELRKRMAALPEPVTEKKPPYWAYWRHELWQHVTNGEDPAGFMGWPCVYHTMLVNHWTEPVEVEFESLISCKNAPRWLEAAWHPLTAGWGLYPSLPDLRNDTPYSRNLIHQLYHLQQWERVTGKQIDDLETIVEFGGGYGAMALVCHRLGFQGKYYIYDLPEFALLQQFFLSGCGVDNVTWLDKPKKMQPDLLMALYSISETPLVQRAEFLRQVKAKSYLFLYSGNWEYYDNVAYFRGLEHLAENWKHWELEHLPDRFNFYSVGW